MEPTTATTNEKPVPVQLPVTDKELVSVKPSAIDILTSEQLQLLQQTWTLFIDAIIEADKEVAKPSTPASSIPAKASSWSIFGRSKTNSIESTPSPTLQPSAANLDSPAVSNDQDSSKTLSMLYELGLAMHGEDPDVYVMRFLRARKWVPEDAVNMLVNMLRWRASFGVRQILLEAEGPLHKSEMKRCQSYFCGTDKEGRICCFVHANRHNTSDLVRNLSEKLIVLTMESACMILQQPEFKSTTATMLVDLRDAGIQHQDSIATRFMLNVMQNYYPERLGRALIISAPWIFSGFWQLIKPWLDPVVQAKVVFVSREEVSQYVDISQTVKHLGGEMRDFVYTDAPESELNGITKLRSEMSQTERDDIWASFKQGLDEYVATTLAWCKGTDGVDNGARLIAAKRIQSDYVRLTPIVRAPTNYHRMGIHRDEAFKSIVTLV